MDAEEIYTLWTSIFNYFPVKDREEALGEFLNSIYEADGCEISDLVNVANEYDDEFFVREGKRFIKENDLEEDYDD